MVYTSVEYVTIILVISHVMAANFRQKQHNSGEMYVDSLRRVPTEDDKGAQLDGFEATKRFLAVAEVL